jgi:predicted nucleic acid-binding protein
MMSKKSLEVYVDASVVGGCEDHEFRESSLALWQKFIAGDYRLVLSAHTLRELEGAPEPVLAHLDEVPEANQIVLPDSFEASELAEAYVRHGVIGAGSHADALHIALATIARVDALVSWNFRHIVNLGRIRLFNAVNLEQGYGILEIRSPSEVQDYE